MIRPLESALLQPEVLQLSISSMTLGRDTLLEIATGISSDHSALCHFLNCPHLCSLIWTSSYNSKPIDPHKSYIKLLRYLAKRSATMKNHFSDTETRIREFEDSLAIGEQTFDIRYQHWRIHFFYIHVYPVLPLYIEVTFMLQEHLSQLPISFPIICNF